MTKRLNQVSVVPLLLASVVLSCLFGGVYAYVQVVACVLLLSGFLTWGWAELCQHQPQRVTSVVFLCMAAVCAGGLQCVSLTPEVTGLFSPKVTGFRTSLLDDQISSTTTTLGQASTRHATALLIVSCVALFLSSRLFYSSRRLKLLFLVFAVNGAVLALLGVLQKLRWNGEGFWPVPTGFASFVNRNNAAGFLNIALAAAMGLLVAVWKSPKKSSSSQTSSLGFTCIDQLLRFTAELNATKLMASIPVVIIAAGVISTTSRGGIISATGAGIAVATLLLSKGRWLAVAALTLLAVGTVGLAQLSDQWDIATERLNTLAEPESYSGEDRLRHWADMSPGIRDFWLTGSGLGTYGDVNRIYQLNTSGEGWFHHAENQYLEALVEGGIIGFGLMLTCLLVVSRAAFRLFERRRKSLPLAVCGCFAVTSQAIHAAFDFGLYIPANAIAFAIVCGAVVGRDDYLRQRFERGKSSDGGSISLVSRLGVIGTVLTLLVLALLEIRHVQLSEFVRYGSVATLFGSGPEPTFEERWVAGHELLAKRPDDARLQLSLAEMHIERYRAQALQQLRDEFGQDANDEVLVKSTSMRFLHQRVAELRQGPDSEAGIERLRKQPVIRENLVPARAHLIAARRANPLLFRVHLRLAELSFLEDDANDQRHMDRAKLISPAHPDVMYWAGVLELIDGRTDQACTSWRQCLRFSDRYTNQILDAAHDALPSSSVLAHLLPEDRPKLLLRLAKSYYSHGDRLKDRSGVLDCAEQALQKSDLAEAERLYINATIDWALDETDNATTKFEQALQLSPENAAWRYEFATFLYEAGQLDYAKEQVIVAGHFDSGEKHRYERLLGKIVDGMTGETAGVQPTYQGSTR